MTNRDYTQTEAETVEAFASLIRGTILFVLLLLPSLAFGQVAYDAYSDTTAISAVDFSWVHTPVGTPAAVIVSIYQTATGADRVTSITYGNVSMTEVSGSPAVKGTPETGGVYMYVLFAGIPTGAQPVEVVVGGVGSKIGTCVTLTASRTVEIVDVDATINTDSDDDPAVTLSLGGRTSFCMLAAYSGQGDPTGTTPFSSWDPRDEFDFGAACGLTYTYVVGTADVTAGWTQTADDAIMIAIALSEVSGQGLMIVE